MVIRIPNLAIKSYFLMAKYAIPELRRRGGGVIINTASVQGLQSQKLVPAYAASKGGIRSLTRKMALDYEAENIRVLAVCPGMIDTKWCARRRPPRPATRMRSSPSGAPPIPSVGPAAPRR